MRKAQVSIFVILGLVLLLIMSVYMFYVSRNSIRSYEEDTDKVTTLSDVNIDSRNYINSCIKDSVQEAIENTGIREENINQYKTIVTEKITECTKELFNNLEEMDYKVEVSNIIIEVVFEDETISVEVIYPIVIEHDGQKIDFSKFNYVFDRSTSISIPNGVADRDITIVSSDRNTELKIKKGTKITDKDGNPVENIGIKVEDVHFDGLENKYILGELVYNNFPDGTYFSEPVEISIEFQPEDLPEGYIEENIKIAWWNKENEIWYAIDTAIMNNRTIANITHFTTFGNALGHITSVKNLVFQQRFTPFGAGQEDGGVWSIGVGPMEIGTATLQPNFAYKYRDRDISQIEMLKEEYPDKYVDFIFDVIQGGGYVTAPEVIYGYDDINCMTDFNGDGISEVRCIEKEGYPYCWLFGSVNYKCSNEECPIDGSNICSEQFYGYSPDGEQLCFPTENGNVFSSSYEQFENRKLKEKEYLKPDSTIESIETACCLGTPRFSEDELILGFGNHRCSAGTLSPGTGIDMADYMIFEKGAVIYSNFLTGELFLDVDVDPLKIQIGEKIFTPNFGTAYDVGGSALVNSIEAQFGINDLNKLKNKIGLPKWDEEQLDDRSEILIASLGQYPFYCNIIEFPDGKWKMEKTEENILFGINKLECIKRIDMNSKLTMQTTGSVIYTYWGSGYIRSNVPIDNSEVKTIV